MEPEVVVKPLDVDSRLHSMGLNRDDLLRVIRYAESERSLCTDNDPIGFASVVVYARAGRRMREIFMPKGWERDDSNNQAAIRNPETKVRIVPCNFDEFAGDRLVIPSNKSPKGEVSRKKSMCNRTAWIPGLVDDASPIDVEGYNTWLLGLHIDENRATTAELSLPIEFDGNYFTQFGTRIILLDGTEDKLPERKGDSDESFGVIEISITRK